MSFDVVSLFTLIPSTADVQAQVTNKVLKTLELNGYKRNFIERTFRGNKQKNKKDKESRPCGVTCLPYVHGLSEKKPCSMNNRK